MRSRPITTAVLFAIVGSFPLFLAGAYAVRIQEALGATKSQFGLAAAAYFATATIGSIRLGRLVDARGTRFGGVAAAIGGSAASLFIGLAATNWWMLGCALGLTGFSNTAGQLAGNRILANAVERDRQGFGFGAKQAAVPLGSFLAGGAVALLGPVVEWRTAFVGYAVVALAVVGLAPEFGAVPAGSAPRRRGVGEDRPALLVLALAGMLIGAAGNGLAVLVVDAFEDAGFEPGLASSMLAFGGLASIIGRVGIGHIVDRRGSDGYTELTAIVLAGVVGFGALAVGTGNLPVMIVGVGLGFAAGWGWPAIIYLVTVRASTAPPGTTTGYVLTGVFFGAIVGAPLFAFIAERASYGVSWGTAGAMSLVSAVGIQVSRRLVRVHD